MIEGRNGLAKAMFHVKRKQIPEARRWAGSEENVSRETKRSDGVRSGVSRETNAAKDIKEELQTK